MNEELIGAKTVIAVGAAAILFGGLLAINGNVHSLWGIVRLAAGLAMIVGGVVGLRSYWKSA